MSRDRAVGMRWVYPHLTAPWGVNKAGSFWVGVIILRWIRKEKNIMSKKVYIDEEECIGCGSCEEICPEVFKLNEDTEKAEVIKPEGGPEDLIEEAMTTCPVECIHWEE